MWCYGSGDVPCNSVVNDASFWRGNRDVTPRRILLVFPDPPIPFGNAAARWYFLLFKELVARGHRVTAFTAFANPAQAAEATSLFPAPQYDLRLHPYPERAGLSAKLATLSRPFSYMFSDALCRDLDRELAAGYDVLHLEQLTTGWVGLGARNRAVVNVHFLFDIDLSNVRPVGLRGHFERWNMRRAERTLLSAFPRFTAVSDRLRERISELAPGAEVTVSPFGLDLALYPFIPDNERTHEPVVSVIGSMNWQPSRSAAVRALTRLWPEIHRRVPAAQLQIVGREARSRAIARCADHSAKGIGGSGRGAGVACVGYRNIRIAVVTA